MEQQGFSPHFFIQMAIIFGIFYFLVIRPQQKRQKQLKQEIDSLKKNDAIVTASGIHGTVVNIKEKTVVIRIDDHAKMEIEKEAVATVVKAQG